MRRRPYYVWTVAVVSLIYPSLAAQASRKATSASQHNPQATCATATLNYITHYLPQQCLRTTPSTTSDGSPAILTSHAPQDISSIGSAHTTPTVLRPDPSSADAGERPASTYQSDASPIGQTSSSIQSASAAATTPTVEPSQVSEPNEELPLDEAKFLSFEDWMKQNLGATGQSAEAIARAKGQAETIQDRQRPGNTLDTLGEDSEISFEFDGFGGGIRESAQARQSGRGTTKSQDEPGSAPANSGPSGARSKDAGKTCKERFNYASFDCAANILKTNPRCKSSSSILVENKDSYMLNECSMDNKFLIVELCDHIQIDTVVLANFEFFSSMFRTFRISVSDRYPVKLDKWRELGTYEARNSREIQAFLVENPLIWARYLRVEFLTHYGSEFYCPLSLLRVHGTTMMEDYRHTEDLARGVIDTGDDDEEGVVVVPAPLASGHAGAPNAVLTPLEAKSEPATAAIVNTVQVSAPLHQESLPSKDSAVLEQPNSGATQEAFIVTHSFASITTPRLTNEADLISDKPSSPVSPTYSKAIVLGTPSHSAILAQNSPSKSLSTPVAIDSASTGTPPSSRATHDPTPSGSRSISPATPVELPASSTPTSVMTSRSTSTSTVRLELNDTDLTSGVSDSTHSVQINKTVQISSNTNVSSTVSTQSSTSVVPQSTQPATQESFFKTLSKRLTSLESNASLSLQYIESQSSILRSAFAATSSHQLNKTAIFLAHLNATVLNELAAARADYDQLWQSTVLELAGQRDEGRRERELLGERVRLLAEEVVGTKRLMAAQAALLLLVLGIVVFSRTAPFHHSDSDGGSIDLRLLSSMQGLMQRGRSGMRRVASRNALATASNPDSNHLAIPKTSREEQLDHAQRGWRFGSGTPDASPGDSTGHTRPGTAGSDNEFYANHQHNHHLYKGPSHSRNVSGNGSSSGLPRSPFRLDKPLPLKPFDGSSSVHEDDESRAYDHHHDTNDDHNTRLAHEPADVPLFRPPTHNEDFTMAPESLISPPQHPRPDPLVLADRRAAALRGTRSAPPTPRAVSPPPQNLLPTPEVSDAEDRDDDRARQVGFESKLRIRSEGLGVMDLVEDQQQQQSPTWHRVENKKSRRRSRGKSGGGEMRDGG